MLDVVEAEKILMFDDLAEAFRPGGGEIWPQVQ
jgi:hypothetical protein